MAKGGATWTMIIGIIIVLALLIVLIMVNTQIGKSILELVRNMDFRVW